MYNPLIFFFAHSGNENIVPSWFYWETQVLYLILGLFVHLACPKSEQAALY